MAVYTIYLLISIAAVLITLMSVVKNLYFRRTGILMFGKRYKPETPEHKRLKKIFSNRNLAINTILSAIFLANLVYVVYTILRSPYDDRMLVIFILAALFVIGIFAALTRAESVKRAIEHDKKKGPWLS